ncbi:hypothetical protein [Larkinella terrae]|uniref:Uncharacterized protein n=1 Tax=Larkinella terrae TaxID=2025311 RepID=A0A7K0EIR6_9BACT|nr:hypothetical protein [Larkinella terrae]MRS61733.1 hypothetical protein [Larkinella terrae]
MKTASKNYTNAQLDLLYGQIKDTKYSLEVHEVLKEWVKTGKIAKKFKHIDQNKIRLVVFTVAKKFSTKELKVTTTNSDYYIEEVWDAVVEVIKRRKAKSFEKAAQIEEALA